MTIGIEEMATFCKKKGFVYPSAEIYGGLSGFFDFGPLGVELKNNIKTEWWKTFVKRREDIVGIDATVVNHPKIWQASGHAECFNDIFIECTKCRNRIRADHFVEEELKIKAEGLHAEDLNKLILENKLNCPNCKSDFSNANPFNLMFKTHVGPLQSEETVAYLRPETAQLMFTNFKLIVETSRVKLPFGIAQVGLAFRNEISPRDFLFRVREFEQMEIEFFTHPKKQEDCPYLDEVADLEVNLITEKEQADGKPHHKTTIKDMIENKLLKKWHAYWVASQYQWFINLGIQPKNLRVRQHLKKELAHYATACFDIEYKFPFGWKEIYGNAARGDFDLTQHQKHSKKSLEIFDEETKEKFIPTVASEPSQGVGRAFLTFMFDAYNYDEARGNVVLKLHPKLAPIQVAIFPLLKNKPELVEKAKSVFGRLQDDFAAFYDESGSIGRRYARADEIGVPLCVTIDFDSLENDDVTIRNRDTTEQSRVSVKELSGVVSALIKGKVK